jgi:hypothetical protein
MENKYRVQIMEDNIYEVIELNNLVEGQSWDGWDDSYQDVKVFQGTISDCEAWIRLNDNGYIL